MIGVTEEWARSRHERTREVLATGEERAIAVGRVDAEQTGESGALRDEDVPIRLDGEVTWSLEGESRSDRRRARFVETPGDHGSIAVLRIDTH